MTYPRAERKRQQITRVPPYHPGDWIRIKDAPEAHDLAGRVRLVRSLTCSIWEPGQHVAVWRVCFGDGRCLPVSLVERHAEPHEIPTAARRDASESRRRAEDVTPRGVISGPGVMR